jgi:hypothetical protein
MGGLIFEPESPWEVGDLVLMKLHPKATGVRKRVVAVERNAPDATDYTLVDADDTSADYSYWPLP